MQRSDPHEHLLLFYREKDIFPKYADNPPTSATIVKDSPL